MNEAVKQKLQTLPLAPGVYIFKNITGEVIYVGKAKYLKNRVSSYFQSGILPGTKTYALVERINDIDHVLVQNELEALILEAGLIKKYRPKYNIIQKDDKSYLYIVMRKDKSSGFTNVFTARETDLTAKDKVYGPYPDGKVTKEILRKLRTVFPYKDCSVSKYNLYTRKKRPCLYGHLGLCLAPCINGASIEAKDKANLLGIKRVLAGNSNQLITSYKKNMAKASKSQDYEQAILYRDTLEKFIYVGRRVKSPEQYIENPYLIDDIARQSLTDIKAMLPNILSDLPLRIECYDIANISGKEAVGSMVVATNGKIDKREYKKFRIKLKDTPDDFGMLSEVLHRRFGHLEWPNPNLLLIDGGKGQVATVSKVLNKLNVTILIVGLAKKFETLVYIEGPRFVEAHFPKDRDGMKLLVLLRDEAHRFAQSYHHQLREKSLKISID